MTFGFKADDRNIPTWISQVQCLLVSETLSKIICLCLTCVHVDGFSHLKVKKPRAILPDITHFHNKVYHRSLYVRRLFSFFLKKVCVFSVLSKINDLNISAEMLGANWNNFEVAFLKLKTILDNVIHSKLDLFCLITAILFILYYLPSTSYKIDIKVRKNFLLLIS